MTTDILAFLEQWRHARGRALHVLHIGNIANNAYNNAKIQRRYGIEADVLSFDYYHIMACPEWEDADFEGEIADDMFPDWWAVDLRGFERPRWFAQGPFDISIRYLLAKTKGSATANWLWAWLQFERWLICRKSALRSFIIRRIDHLTGRHIGYVVAPANAILMSWAGNLLATIARQLMWMRNPLARHLARAARRFAIQARTADVVGDASRHLRTMRRYRHFVETSAQHELTTIDRPDRFDDIGHFYRVWFHPYLPLLLDRYDIVQCYATYTALPFIVQRGYMAYEHGTIRSIPFLKTDEGRMCAATYRAAKTAFITNSDNLDAAARLRLDRVVCLPHAFDSDKLIQFAKEAHVEQARESGTTLFFTPTRQHWVDPDPGWAKGNERVFEALRLVRVAGRCCVLHAVAWGIDLESSKARVADLGIEDMVVWLPTMRKRTLWAQYLRAHAVIDQFVVPAIGGVTFEAMMLGRRVISAIDEKQTEIFFGKMPPLFNCRTADEIAAAMLRVIDDPFDKTGAGRANQQWMQVYHSAQRIVELQVQAYRDFLCEKSRALQAGGPAAPGRL